MNDTLIMIVAPTVVIWKWQQYGNNFIAVFPFSPLPSKMLFKWQWQAVEIKLTFNEMSFSQSVLHLPLTMSAYQEAAKWILLDWSSLGKRVIKWGSFNKTFSLKTTGVKAINKSSLLKRIGRHFLSKIEKRNPAKEVHLW